MAVQKITKQYIVFSLLMACLAIPVQSLAYELSGIAGLEGRYFTASPAYTGQDDYSSSLMLEPELYHQYPSGSSFTIKPFLRLDSSDSERSHSDLREAKFLYLSDHFEITGGFDKVFWGSTEFIHLIDIINQTDLVESLDGEEKLGQPMVKISIPSDWGTVDGFLLPMFRERSFPGRDGRFRPPLPVETDMARYESGSEEFHFDLALRYNHTLGDVDFGIYHFTGTSREPLLIQELTPQFQPVLIPYYQQIDQTGIDLQYVLGSWLFKGEAFYRSGQGRDFGAITFGFEYTLVGIFDTSMDIGIIGEYIYDDRPASIAPPYQNDLMAGLRFAFNDAASTEILIGAIVDTEYSSQIYSLEASRRLGDNFKLSIEGGIFSQIDDDDPAASLTKDDYVRVELNYYF